MVPRLATRDNPDDQALRHSVDHPLGRSAAPRRQPAAPARLAARGAATKVVGALLARGLAAEHIIDSPRQADPTMNTIWRNEDDGRAVLLRITAAGLGSIGVERATALGVTEGT